MMALKPWVNWDFEGVVQPGRHFDASDSRARELQTAGLAIPHLDDAPGAVSVQPDPPTRFDEPADPPPAVATRSSSRRRGVSATVSTSGR